MAGFLTPIKEESVEEYKQDQIKQPWGQVPEHIQDLYARSIEGVDSAYHSPIKGLLCEFSDIFSKGSDDRGCTGCVEHHIDTGAARPIRERPRRFPAVEQEEINRQVNDLLKEGKITPSNSPWATNVVLVRKNDGTKRFCVDYRKLNAVTIKDAYPIPRIDDSIDALTGAQWFSTLDLASGYWEVALDGEAHEKSAFVVRGGLYSWRVMPFGLCNAPSTFERLMERVLSGLHWETLLVYLDDVIVFGKTIQEEISRLSVVFQRLKGAGLKLKPKKCDLFKQKVYYLGHIVSPEGISTDPGKIEVVKHWPVPESVKEVRSFLGLASYYMRFIEAFSTVARPLHRVTEKNREFHWNEECQASFEVLKKRLTEAPILAYPDPDGKFILDTDASATGIGGVLSQIKDGKEHVVAYASKVLKKAEPKYCVTRRELLAVITFLKQFRPYIYGRRITVRTDHGALRWLVNFKDPMGQVARWLQIIGEYDFEIIHRAGRSHQNADSLSLLAVWNERTGYQ